MTDGHSWESNWKVRLYERVHERGYDSLTAFAEARPTASLVALAEELGEGDVNAVQVFSGLVAEAERSHQLTRLVRGQLVRELSQHLPNGWPAVLDDANRFNVAHALARWSTYTPETHEKRVDQISDALLATPPPTRLAPSRPRRRAAPHAPARRGSLTGCARTALSDSTHPQAQSRVDRGAR